MGLRPRFAAAAQRAQAEKEQRQIPDNGQQEEEEEDDEDSVKGMARLFAELGEAYTGLIATGTCCHFVLSCSKEGVHTFVHTFSWSHIVSCKYGTWLYGAVMRNSAM